MDTEKSSTDNSSYANYAVAFAGSNSSDISNLSLNFDTFVIEIPIHEKSHILNFTERITLEECNFKISLIHLFLDLHCNKFTTNSNEYLTACFFMNLIYLYQR